ncbi:MAG: NAD(P)H-dependent oxidoreductase [Butyrivibrio sp.]|nr:NAD(P)H-dependent oxidoreductase [Butyrivibrio sp.]
MKVCVINFSSRKNGNGHHILEYITEIMSKERGEYDIIDFSSFDVNPCGKCNYECFGNLCIYRDDGIYSAYRKILMASIVVSVIPIYGGLPCSNFFAFNERAQGAFRDEEFGKLESIRNKYIIIGNSGKEITKKIVYENDKNAKEDDFIAVSSNEMGEQSIKGNLMDYEYYRKKIERFIVQSLK